ncbi:hypothetical protein EDD11_007860 [Mortierella claussenii]|nr:hypothetical protein EDD11_007860 [Mortierella claussenii]
MLPHRWETVDIGHIQSIVYGCPFIASLDLSNCTLLRDNAIQMIAEQLGSRCLTSLVLSGCVRITDLAVLSICAYAVRLENLELSECDRISDSSVLELGSATVVAPRVRNQEDMDEEEKDEENENASTIVLGVSRTIKSLDLSHCTRITDTGIKGLRMGATQLSSLNLEGCYGVLAGNEGLDDNEWEDFDDMDEAFITAGTEIHAIEES